MLQYRPTFRENQWIWTRGTRYRFFTQSYDDLETLLAAHRFAWVTVAGDATDPDWVAVLWNAWLDRFVGRGWKTSGSAVMSHN